ncbi:DUF2971 domain-containing protein [Burkholderia sp. Ax-1724]|uniref:DUF2971 domain-containing protein n=1 Tax=Burkholderia sp. Ax-1724 TaxID=2608336 RepID=UPI0014224E6C|nr:DUF2971 domain-containing protein [Burkholderia sp. Ax-1724]NIF55573.1 DUF2971 domain-containing protein [Burkholderia sp. Ax-1724]
MLIYKYVAEPRFFSNFMFRFTPAEDLNDPQELVPDIRLRDPIAYAKAVTDRNIERAYFQMLLLHPDISPDQAWQRIRGAADQLEQQFDPVSKVEEIYEAFMRTTNKNVGVLSLTEDPHNASMWAHYAADYEGLVIGLDSHNEFFQPKPDEPKVCGQLMNVLYTSTSPVVYVEPGRLDIPKEIFFTKTPIWESEKEWRIIKYLPQATEIKDLPEGKKIHLFAVPPEAIKEVIFGSKISSEAREFVEKALQTHAPHVLRKRIKFVRGVGLSSEDC